MRSKAKSFSRGASCFAGIGVLAQGWIASVAVSDADALAATIKTRACVTATWDDVPHLSAEQKAKMWAAYPAHEREARARGVPMLGSGQVFAIDENTIKIPQFAIPREWAQINGIDFGIDHPFGAVNLAWDRDADCFYVTKSFRQSGTSAIIHAAAVKPWGEWVPTAWPHDGLQKDKGSGEELASQYRAQGLNMLPERATFEDGGNGVEAGIMDMLDRMQTGRLKVFSHLNDWFEEFRTYHRKDGQIVKLKDDLLSATRYAIMMKRHAKVKPEPAVRRRVNLGTMA